MSAADMLLKPKQCVVLLVANGKRLLLDNTRVAQEAAIAAKSRTPLSLKWPCKGILFLFLRRCPLAKIGLQATSSPYFLQGLSETIHFHGLVRKQTFRFENLFTQRHFTRSVDSFLRLDRANGRGPYALPRALGYR
jgi:hypothetical protein